MSTNHISFHTLQTVKNWMLYLLVFLLTLIDTFIIFIEAVNPQTRNDAKILYDKQIITEVSLNVQLMLHHSLTEHYSSEGVLL